ncbi:hypothetical protein D3C73_1033340 [compost metagenome]
MAPLIIVGSRRPSLYLSSGTSGSSAPYFSTLCDTRTLAVRPSLVYSSAEPRGLLPLDGSRPLLLLSGLESSLNPAMPNASTPKPSVPSVNPDCRLRMKPWADSSRLDAPCSLEVWPSRKSRLKYTVRDSMFAVVSSIKPLAWAGPVKPAHSTRAPKPNDWRTKMNVKGGRIKKLQQCSVCARAQSARNSLHPVR